MTNELMFTARTGGMDPPVYPVKVDWYPGGEPLIDFPRDQPVARILLRPSSLASFMAAMFWVDALAERGHELLELVLPFVPGARQDRLNDAGDYLFTAKSVAKEINARRFDTVTIVDPHSDVVPALIDHCRVVTAADCLMSFGRGYSAVVAPDGGAAKRATGVARKLNVPLLHAWKTRDVQTAAIHGFGLQPFGGAGRVLVVDDICDGGGTFIGLAGELERVGLRADLYVTHGVFSKGTAPLLALFRHVFCTDSVLGDKPGVAVMPICERLLTGA